MDFLRFLRDNANWLFVGVILSFTSSFGQTFFISLFADDVMASYSLTHGQWGGIYTLGTAASAVVMVWAGVLTDRFRVRVLAPAVFAGLAVSCVLMSLNQSLWALPVIIFLLRFFGQGMSSHVSVVSAARWFSANRGRALAVTSMGFALGQALLPYLFVSAKGSFDWRTLWLVAALAAALAIFPLIALLRQERTPQSHAESSVSVGMSGRHWTRTQMIRNPLIWFLLPTIIGPSAWNTALFFQQVHLAQIKGWQHADFVSLIPLFTIVAATATFLSGWAVDRFGSGWLLVLQGAPLSAGFALLWYSDSLGSAAVAMTLIGVAAGSFATLPGAFAAEYYGTRYLGGIKSVWSAAMVLGSAIGPGISGWMIDLGFDFTDQSLAIAGYFAISTLALAIGVARANRSLPARS